MTMPLLLHPYRIPPALALGLCCVSATLWLAGCASPPPSENVPPPRIDQQAAPVTDAAPQALDWVGTYQAVLPCADCPGIAISVQLRTPHSAVVRERRLGSDIDQQTAQTYAGPVHWEAQPEGLITLQQEAAAPAYRFLVADGWIELRDRATGAPLPQNTLYRLRKTSTLAP